MANLNPTLFTEIAKRRAIEMPRLGRMRASGCADRSGDGIRAPAVGGAGPWTSATARTPTGERRASSGPGVGTSDPEITSHDVRDAI
jgi:hypothetical protein